MGEIPTAKESSGELEIIMLIPTGAVGSRRLAWRFVFVLLILLTGSHLRLLYRQASR